MKTQFQHTLLAHMGFEASLLVSPGVSVAADPERAESHVTAGYAIGEHMFITCDPAVEDMLAEAAPGMEPGLAGWAELGSRLGGEFLGSGRHQLLTTHDLSEPVLPEGFQLRSLARDDAHDLALLEQLIDVSSEDDLDEAELELDNLDEIMSAVVDGDGQIASLASSRPFDMAPDFGDIGILTRTDCRATGLGSAAVIALSQRLLAADIEPLYRCDEDNIGSIELSRGLLFSPVAMLSAFRFPVV